MEYAAFDIGGTFVKFAATGADGAPLPGTVGETPIDSGADREGILSALRAAVCAVREAAPGLTRAAVSIPGPFDYDAGVSHMTHKFAAIEGVSLKAFFAENGLEAEFLHDSTAFLLGEMLAGAARGAQNPFGVMLGTGLGFAMAREGRVLVNDSQRPALSLWNTPFRGGIAEDFVSRRALRARYAALSGAPDATADVKEICDAARAGDGNAKTVLSELSDNLAALLAPLVARYAADCLVIGGQIARSHALFLPPVARALGIPVRPAEHLGDAALRGAALYAIRSRAACVRVFPV